MYRIAICDDEPVFLEHAAALLDEILAAHNISFSLRSFDSAGALLAAMEDGARPFDLLLLDILLGGGDNGVALAAQLRKGGSDVGIIYLTSSADYLLEGYETEAVGYVLKPVDKAKLEEALLRAYNRAARRMVVLATPAASVGFRLDEVLYIEVYDKALRVHVGGSSTEIMMSLKEAREKLPEGQFVLCHRSYLVSIPAVLSIRRYEITLKNGEKIPVSRSSYNAVQEALLRWSAQG